VEEITPLNCIEGWTVVVRWAGARFADFTAKNAPQFRDARYVGMQTPDQAYFVGLRVMIICCIGSLLHCCSSVLVSETRR
jgi:DMSO/TMAO reductase YedYZ molybdopterin-dependent catalytic subunit